VRHSSHQLVHVPFTLLLRLLHGGGYSLLQLQQRLPHVGDGSSSSKHSIAVLLLQLRMSWLAKFQ
jgi:hypothetical protein